MLVPDMLRPALLQIVKPTRELSLLHRSNQASFQLQPRKKTSFSLFRCAPNGMLPFSGNIRNAIFLESFYAKFKRHYRDSSQGRDTRRPSTPTRQTCLVPDNVRGPE